MASGRVKRVRSDCTATVHIGEYARGGLTRGDHQAREHDMGCKEQYVPCGIVDEERAELPIPCGSSYKTRAGIVEALTAKWAAWDEHEKAATSLLHIHMDTGPESSGRRTQFLSRMVQLADDRNQPIPLLYSPPSHSKYPPIERGWGLWELQWNGTQRIDAETMVAWAKRMTWKGLSPVVERSHTVDQKGIALGKAAMPTVEKRWERHPALPKYDILINPAPTA